jgi:hypothetical protein
MAVSHRSPSCECFVNCPAGNRRPSAAVQDGVMTRRLALPLLAVVAGLTAACGSEKVDVSDQSGGWTSYPGGTDQAVVELSTGGGFVPEGADFHTPPELLIMGDGTVYRPGAQIAIFPAPLLPAITTATLDPDGLRAVLDAADKAGLLKEPPSYEPAPGAAQVADAPTTSLEIHADGQTFHHEAYALGFQPNGVESTPQRNSLDRFVTQLKDLTSLVGAEHLTAEEVYTPERFGVIARVATPEELAPTPDQITPEVVPWPESAPPLASMSTCTEVPAAAVGDTFDQANQLTRFSQAGSTYTVFVRVLLPGEACDSFSAGPPIT